MYALPPLPLSLLGMPSSEFPCNVHCCTNLFVVRKSQIVTDVELSTFKNNSAFSVWVGPLAGLELLMGISGHVLSPLDQFVCSEGRIH